MGFIKIPSTLSSPTSRAASYESSSSNGSQPRSTTPRPSHPLITVSLSTDNVSEYRKPFYMASAGRTPTFHLPRALLLPALAFPFYPRRGQTPASAVAAAHRQATTSNGDDRRVGLLGTLGKTQIQIRKLYGLLDPGALLLGRRLVKVGRKHSLRLSSYILLLRRDRSKL